MDHCASVLLAFPPISELDDEEYDKAARTHVLKAEKLVKQNGPNFQKFAEQLFNVVDPAAHSVSYLALLLTVVTRENGKPPTLVERTARFLLTFDARQTRFAGVAFSKLVSRVQEGWLFSASVTVELLVTALLRLDPTGSILTSHHLPVVSLAYRSDNIDLVLPLIEKTIAYYPVTKSTETRPLSNLGIPPVEYITWESGLTEKLTSSTVLEYDLLLGMCFIQRNRWQQAFDALERVVTYPTSGPGSSKIMVEAHNKWLLVGLILNGKTPTLPSTTAPSVHKSYQTVGKPYLTICEAFEKDSGEALLSESSTLGDQFFAKENNLGLIRVVLIYYQKWQILNLREVYSKISLEQIRRCTESAETGGPLSSVSEVEAVVQMMIDEGMLSGVIEKPLEDGKPAHLVFLTPPEEHLTEEEIARDMVYTAQRLKDLAPVVKATNERLATNQEYLRHIAREQRKEQSGSAGRIAHPYELQVEDEDLMTGIVRS